MKRTSLSQKNVNISRLLIAVRQRTKPSSSDFLTIRQMPCPLIPIPTVNGRCVPPSLHVSTRPQGRRPRRGRSKRRPLGVEELRFRRAGTKVIHSLFLPLKPVSLKDRQRSQDGRCWPKSRSFANPKVKANAVPPSAGAACLAKVLHMSIFISATVNRPGKYVPVCRVFTGAAVPGFARHAHPRRLWNELKMCRQRLTPHSSAAGWRRWSCSRRRIRKICRSPL